MADHIAITTWPRHQNLYYLFTGSAITFDVKAVGNATIGLSKTPIHGVEYWVCIGDNNRCWIKKDNEHLKSAHVPNILSSEEYTTFWLQWNAGAIRLGRQGEQKPLLTYTNKVPNLKYVTFGVLNQNNPVHWRFDLPPVRETAKVEKPISGGKLIWVHADDQLPEGALIGGFENEIVYIIRAPHRESLTPGKFLPSEGRGYISWGGEAHGKGEFEVLCGFDCTWEPTQEDKIPDGSVVGGFSEDRQERLYIGRAVHNGHTIPGKVQPSHKACYIAFEGREIGKKRYEILVEPTITLRSANKTYLPEVYFGSASESEQEDDTWHAEVDDEILSNDEMNEMMAL